MALALLVLGRAVRGALGGAAFGVSVSLLRSQQPKPLKYALSLAAGVAAVGVWFVIALAIAARR